MRAVKRSETLIDLMYFVVELEPCVGRQWFFKGWTCNIATMVETILRAYQDTCKSISSNLTSHLLTYLLSFNIAKTSQNRTRCCTSTVHRLVCTIISTSSSPFHYDLSLQISFSSPSMFTKQNGGHIQLKSGNKWPRHCALP